MADDLDKRWDVLMAYNHSMFHHMVARLAAGAEYPISTFLQGAVFATEYPELARQMIKDFREKDVFQDPAWLAKAADELAEDLRPLTVAPPSPEDLHARG